MPVEKKKPIEQYEHKDKERVNNPPVGLVTSDTDKETSGKKTYSYDPHLDPQLIWAGKAEHTSFEVPTVSLHVHERIDPRTIIEAVRKRNGHNYAQMSLFNVSAENPPLREAVEFYKHSHNWSNRLIAGDSLLVMNSLIEKEGMAGKVQMVYIDPPYGIKYGSNFQPFVNKRNVTDGKDEDLTAEPEMIKAFRDTWELEVHSYLTYLRDRLLLAKELLSESGSIFVQISDENVHLIRNLMDEIFGPKNFLSQITFQKSGGSSSTTLERIADYLLWYCKDVSKAKQKYHGLMNPKVDAKNFDKDFVFIESPDGEKFRRLTAEEIGNPATIPRTWRRFRSVPCNSQEYSATRTIFFEYKGKKFHPGADRHWSIDPAKLSVVAEKNRLFPIGNSLMWKLYEDEAFEPIKSVWLDTSYTGFGEPKVYVVQTTNLVIQRCLLMTTDPGDLVFDPTCGSGTTAYVAEQWGRRWITCDTSRVSITLAKQRLMTALYDYYELAHPDEGVGSGFKYKTVPHITLKSIANNEPAGQETLYDQPHVDNSKARVSGPFTVEAVPAPVVKPLEEIKNDQPADDSVARSGETLRQTEWRDELLRTGIRGKNGQYILFSRVESLPGRWLHADAETKPNDAGADSVKEKRPGFGEPQRAVISFGPEHAPLEQRQVENAIEEALKLVPKPKLIVFAAFQFDPEA
ncbi:MAG: site-specific DNA-methyltransferase, partial [Calditrichota bacterium]